MKERKLKPVYDQLENQILLEVLMQLSPNIQVLPLSTKQKIKLNFFP